MIHYTQIIWEEVAFIWKVTGKAVAIFMTGTVFVVCAMLPCMMVSSVSYTYTGAVSGMSVREDYFLGGAQALFYSQRGVV